MRTNWLLLQGGRVIDGLAANAHDEWDVLVHDDRIEAVGPDLGVDIRAKLVPRGDELEIVDARGKTVMPGLVDLHCHLTFGESLTQEEEDLYTSVEVRTLRSAWNAQKILLAGVTSIAQPGGSYNIGVGIREGIREGLIRGPRMISAGRFISNMSGLGSMYPTWIGVPESGIGFVAESRDSLVAEVRREVKNGVDFIKLADSVLGDFAAFTYDELRSVTDVAHQLGKRVTIHARGSAEVALAVRAEVDWIMHANVMTDEAIGMVADAGIPIVPTLTLQMNSSEWGHLAGVSSSRRDRAKRLLDISSETYARARPAGVRFATGSDTGFGITPYGLWHARELEAFVKVCGLSPMEAIISGTREAGAIVRPEGDLGVLRVGALADMLVVNGQPERDVTVLQDPARIETRILGGERVEVDPALLEIFHPYDRARIQASRMLTRSLVLGGGDPSSTEQAAVEDGRDAASVDAAAKDLAAELLRVTREAERETESDH